MPATMSLPSPTSPKMLFQVPSFALALLGFILMWVALATPAWQVVYARELQQWIQSGLWLTCQTRPQGMVTCTWMFSQRDFDFYSSPDVAHYRTPAFYPWQRHLLHIFMAVQATVLLALLAFCASNSHSMQKCAVALFTICMSIAALTSFVLIITFMVYSHMIAYRFYTVSVSGIYEKLLGYSFYIAVLAAFLYLGSVIFSGIYLLRVLRDSSSSDGLQRMAKGPGHSQSTAYTYNSRDDYRAATSHDDFDPHFSFEPSYRSSHQFSNVFPNSRGGSQQQFMVEQHYAMKPLPASPGSRRY